MSAVEGYCLGRHAVVVVVCKRCRRIGTCRAAGVGTRRLLFDALLDRFAEADTEGRRTCSVYENDQLCSPYGNGSNQDDEA